jgi:hypothetical protein
MEDAAIDAVFTGDDTELNAMRIELASLLATINKYLNVK